MRRGRSSLTNLSRNKNVF